MATQATTAQVAEPQAKSAKPSHPARVLCARTCIDSSAVAPVNRTPKLLSSRAPRVHRAGKKNSRGASAEHATTVEQARTAVEKLAAAAEKAGWKRREERGGGFARRPDAFALDSLPKPGKSAKK